jgi:uncharacterized protein (DUF1697 family)
MAERQVALLRGINVSGKNPLPMKALGELFVRAGASDVTTYIQSGNVVFRPNGSRSNLAVDLARRIERDFGLRVPVILRSAAEWRKLLRSNPFLRGGAEDSGLHVMFLAEPPAVAAVAELDPLRSPPDEFRVVGREVYLSCPNGIGRSKLTNDYFDKKLGTISTCRNWRTVLKLGELLEA